MGGCLARFAAAMRLVEAEAVFSANEVKDDMKTADLKCATKRPVLAPHRC